MNKKNRRRHVFEKHQRLFWGHFFQTNQNSNGSFQVPYWFYRKHLRGIQYVCRSVRQTSLVFFDKIPPRVADRNHSDFANKCHLFLDYSAHYSLKSLIDNQISQQLRNHDGHWRHQGSRPRHSARWEGDTTCPHQVCVILRSPNLLHRYCRCTHVHW